MATTRTTRGCLRVPSQRLAFLPRAGLLHLLVGASWHHLHLLVLPLSLHPNPPWACGLINAGSRGPQFRDRGTPHRLPHPRLSHHGFRASQAGARLHPRLHRLQHNVCAIAFTYAVGCSTGSTASSSSKDNAKAKNPQMITVSVPLNTTIVGGLVTRRELRIPSELIFADFYSRVCANMDVKPEDASIGFKYHTDRARDPPQQLSNEGDYEAMRTEMVRRVLAARSRTPVLFIHNLVRHWSLSHFKQYPDTDSSVLQSTLPLQSENARMMPTPKIQSHDRQQPLISLANSGSYVPGSPVNFMATVPAVSTLSHLATTN